MMKDEYTQEFFEWLRQGALRSAEVIVPFVLDLIQPRSVVDVGCGTGAWLAAFARHGVKEYLGVDAFVPAGLLEIPRDRFVEVDLTRPLSLGRQFDLAVSLEVGEHLPDSAAKMFVESLTRLASVVLFSAAIPGQGGTGHLNEQWPEYWSRLFADCGFDPFDVVRPRVWRDERVEVWYAQNTILYVERRKRAELPGLDRVSGDAEKPLAAVHPRLLEDRDRRLADSFRAHAAAAAEVVRLSSALDAERASVLALGDKIGHLEQVAAEKDARAERCLEEGTKAHARAKASSREAERQQAEAERLQAELLGARTELDALRAEVERYRFLSNPSNMRLGDYLRALPQVVRRVLRARRRPLTRGQ